VGSIPTFGTQTIIAWALLGLLEGYNYRHPHQQLHQLRDRSHCRSRPVQFGFAPPSHHTHLHLRRLPLRLGADPVQHGLVPGHCRRSAQTALGDQSHAGSLCFRPSWRSLIPHGLRRHDRFPNGDRGGHYCGSTANYSHRVYSYDFDSY
jgi:hypothetical protein